jgi:hypothetical protein
VLARRLVLAATVALREGGAQRVEVRGVAEAILRALADYCCEGGEFVKVAN